jgi:hypothetical protein
MDRRDAMHRDKVERRREAECFMANPRVEACRMAGGNRVGIQAQPLVLRAANAWSYWSGRRRPSPSRCATSRAGDDGRSCRNGCVPPELKQSAEREDEGLTHGQLIGESRKLMIAIDNCVCGHRGMGSLGLNPMPPMVAKLSSSGNLIVIP